MVMKLCFLCAGPHFPSNFTFYSWLCIVILFFLMAHVHWSFSRCYFMKFRYLTYFLFKVSQKDKIWLFQPVRAEGKGPSSFSRALGSDSHSWPPQLDSGRWQNGALRPIYKGTSRRGLRSGSSFRESSSMANVSDKLMNAGVWGPI